MMIMMITTILSTGTNALLLERKKRSLGSAVYGSGYLTNWAILFIG